MANNFNNDSLIHYGIKGMKWGVRRTPVQLGHRIKSKFRSTYESSKGSRKRITYRKKGYQLTDKSWIGELIDWLKRNVTRTCREM